MALRENIKKPAPRWFRLTKKIFALTINTVMTVLLLLGYGSESFILLVIKLSESYLMNLLDTILSNGEVYALEDTKTETVTLTQTVTDTTLPPSIAPGDQEQQHNK